MQSELSVFRFVPSVHGGDEMNRGKSRCLGLECLLQPETILGWRGTKGLSRKCEGVKECGLNISNITNYILGEPLCCLWYAFLTF